MKHPPASRSWIAIQAGVLSLVIMTAIGFAQDASLNDLGRKWYQLARHLEADQQFGEAAKAIAKALEQTPQSLPALIAAARIHEQRHAWMEAVEVYEKLATVDRRLRSEHLKKIAQLEARLGRRDKALAAGREVLAAAPGNPEAFELFAQLCFQFGDNDEGLSTLRRAVRANPSDSRTILLLANALADQFRTAEAIELLWQAFEKTRDLDGKLSIVQRLTDLTAQVNQFAKLIERLQRLRRESKEPRELTICLAQAHQQSGDETTAREELESLWTEETRDTQLLQQLVKLCESTADWDDAVRYQRQFNHVAPSRQGDVRLARLHLQAGSFEAASELFLKSTVDETDPEQLLQSLDSMLQHNRASDVLKVTSRLAQAEQSTRSTATQKPVENPLGVSRWELLYREGVALAKLRRKDATESFEAILKLNRSDDELDAATIARRQRESSREPPRGASPSTTTSSSVAANRSAFQQRLLAVHQARSAALNDRDSVIRSSRSATFWTPSDYGQCRAAAQAWLLTLAQSEGRESQFLVERRNDWEKRRIEPRVALDWYHLQTARGDGLGICEAAKALAELPDAPLDFKWAFLQSVAGRSNVAGATRVLSGQVVNVPQSRGQSTPLSNSEVDQVIACLADVQRLTDDSMLASHWMTAAPLLAELRRAGREVQATQIYASLLHDATTPVRALMLWDEAVRIGELETLLRLSRVLFPDDEPASGSTNTPLAKLSAYYATRDYQASLLMAVMAAQVRQNQLDKQIEVFESFLTRSLKAPRPKPPRVSAVTASSSPAAVQLAQRQRTFAIYQGASSPPTMTSMQWEPLPNEQYDRPLMLLLAQMFASHRWANKEDNLCDQFRQRAESTTRADRLYWRLGLSYLEWHRSRRGDAVPEFEKAVALAPKSVGLRLELASQFEQINESAKALQTLDSLLDDRETALDHDERRDAELMALRLAQSLDRTERAKLAAERLFSMNLDAATLLDVSQRMERLGLGDLASAMRHRTRNQAGSQSDVLLTLMRDYLKKEQTNLAAEVAHQILRRTPRSSAQPQTVTVRTSSGRTQTIVRPTNSRGMQTSAVIRQEALQVLHQAGRLADIIAKAEEQLAKSPNSDRLLETLAEYLSAAGQTARDPEVAKRIVALQRARTSPSSSTAFGTGFQPADELATLRTQLQRGDIAGGVTRLENLLKVSPAQVVNRWKEVDAAFHAVQRRDELLKLAEKLDRATIQQCWTIVGNVAGEAIRSPSTHDRGLALLVKALDATPDNLSGLLMLSGINSEVCQRPEIATRIRKAVIPSDSRPLNDYWQGTRLLATAQASNHPLSAFATILLDSCDQPEDLAQLEQSIDTALKSSTVWPGGRVLKGLILLRRGKPKEAEQTLNAVLDEFQATMPAETRFVIAQEVEGITSLAPVATRVLESLAQTTPWPLDPSKGPIQRLLRLYVVSGQPEKARDLLLKNATQPSSVLNTNAVAEREVTRLIEISKQLRSLDFNVEAARVCRDTLANREFFRDLRAGSAKQLRERLDDSLRRAVMKLDADHLFRFLAGRSVTEVSEAANSEKAPTITNWALFLESAGSNEATLRSVFVSVLEQTAQDSVAASLALRSRLSQLRKQQPQDSSLTMLSLLLRLAEKSDPPLNDEALPDLRQLRQQVAAEPPTNIALWLVARECLRASDSKRLAEPIRHELRELGEVLGERAAEAARHAERDPQVQSLAVAIYSEWGQLEFEHGDSDTIEKRWQRLQQAIHPNTDGTAPANAPATPAQFEHFTRFATQAAAHDYLSPSMRAIAKSLELGPPMEAFEWKQFQAGDEFRTGFGPDPRDDARFCVITKSVAEQVTRLMATWKTLGASDEQLHDWLLPIVLPANRDPEVLLYARPIPLHSVDGPSGLGATLVKLSVATGKADALRERLEARVTKPRGEFAARVLLVHLAVLQNDAEHATPHLQRIHEMLKTTSRRSTVEAAIQAVSAARRLPQPPPIVALLLDELAAKSKAAGF